MIVPAKDLSSHFWGFLWVLFSNPNRVSQSRSSWGYSLTRLGRRALETVGSSHLSHILQHSHPGQLLLDHPKVVNFLPKLGTISSMIHLEEDTCVPLKKTKQNKTGETSESDLYLTFPSVTHKMQISPKN